MSGRSHFDYVIIGHGLAGLQLALALCNDAWFSTKHIALIDPLDKDVNDRTWSFWTAKPTPWAPLIHKTWTHADIHTSAKHIPLNLKPYTYHAIRALDFYTHAFKILNASPTIHIIKATVKETSETPTTVSITTENETFTAHHVFDSRLPEAYFSSQHPIAIVQHFKGIVIRTKAPVFDANTITMMDYRLKDGAQTTFTYVLPFSKHEALVEFTYFTKTPVDEQTYDHYIDTYIKTYLNVDTYDILEAETGQIPMTTFPFQKYSTKRITKIGTGGGWVKASTGYAFTHTEKKVNQIVKNIKANTLPSKHLFKRKYLFYDKIFLKVLCDENHKGEWLFEQFYSKNTVSTMFRFLDEESAFAEELKIMSALFSWSFIKAFFKTL